MVSTTPTGTPLITMKVPRTVGSMAFVDEAVQIQCEPLVSTWSKWISKSPESVDCQASAIPNFLAPELIQEDASVSNGPVCVPESEGNTPYVKKCGS